MLREVHEVRSGVKEDHRHCQDCNDHCENCKELDLGETPNRWNAIDDPQRSYRRDDGYGEKKERSIRKDNREIGDIPQNSDSYRES